MKNRTLINISGGAIKFIALISAFIHLLRKGEKPNVLTGVSSGAIICFLYVCGRLTEGLAMARKSHNINVIFSKRNNPVNKKGGLSIWAIWRILSGKNYLGEMDNLEKNIREICSVLDFLKYKENPHAPHCYILAIESKTGMHVIRNLKDCTYEEAIDLVIGSSSIAPTIKEREFRGVMLNDGGHRGHSAGAYLLRRNIDGMRTNLKQCITIFSRPAPKDYEALALDKSNNFFNRLINFTIGTFVKETSLNDAFMEDWICEENDIQYKPVYIDKFTEDTYHITPEEIEEGERLGIEAVEKYI